MNPLPDDASLLLVCAESGIEGPLPGPDDEQKERTEEHRVVGSDSVRHEPETLFFENGQLRGVDRHQHDDDGGDDSQPGEQAEKNCPW